MRNHFPIQPLPSLRPRRLILGVLGRAFVFAALLVALPVAASAQAWEMVSHTTSDLSGNANMTGLSCALRHPTLNDVYGPCEFSAFDAYLYHVKGMGVNIDSNGAGMCRASSSGLATTSISSSNIGQWDCSSETFPRVEVVSISNLNFTQGGMTHPGVGFAGSTMGSSSMTVKYVGPGPATADIRTWLRVGRSQEDPSAVIPFSATADGSVDIYKGAQLIYSRSLSHTFGIFIGPQNLLDDGLRVSLVPGDTIRVESTSSANLSVGSYAGDEKHGVGVLM